MSFQICFSNGVFECEYVCMCVLKFTYLYLPTPLLGQDMTKS